MVEEQEEKQYPSDRADKFVVRFPDKMRDRIADAAKKNNRSMNAEIIDRLEQSFRHSAIDNTFTALLGHMTGAHPADQIKAIDALAIAIANRLTRNLGPTQNKKEMDELASDATPTKPQKNSSATPPKK